LTHLRQLSAPIGVSVLCPGIVNTRLFDASRARPIDATQAGSTLRENMRQRLSQAIAPAQVANVLLQAIRDDQFFVLTDADWDDRIRARSVAVLSRSVPDLVGRAR
jgi:hypothetical protein